MKKNKKSILALLTVFFILIGTSAFIISDPKADFTKQNVKLSDKIALSKITTKNFEKGTFKTALKFKHDSSNNLIKEFYGQEILIYDNPKVDKILIGITNNLISRIEIWNKNILIETKEMGFMSKMTWGEVQTMTIDFYDQTNEKYKGKSKVSMCFYSGTVFFGDIGTISLDLTDYGNLNGDKSIGIFAKSNDSDYLNQPKFSQLNIWKNYKSFD